MSPSSRCIQFIRYAAAACLALSLQPRLSVAEFHRGLGNDASEQASGPIREDLPLRCVETTSKFSKENATGRPANARGRRAEYVGRVKGKSMALQWVNADEALKPMIFDISRVKQWLLGTYRQADGYGGNAASLALNLKNGHGVFAVSSVPFASEDPAGDVMYLSCKNEGGTP